MSSTVFMRIEEPRGRAPRRLALWDLGFRPFYLLAAWLALLSVPLWVLQFSGLIRTAWLPSSMWHAHEMVFGYTLAVVIGFLFTAGRNWSGQPTPTGRPLMALALLWVAARLLVLSPWLWASLLLNLAVPWLAAWGLWRALHAAGNRRNYFFVALLLMMGLASAAVHLQQAGWLELPGLRVGLDLLVFMIAVMAGRVVPMFSNNGVPGMQATRLPWLERAALGTVLLLLALDLFAVEGAVLAAGLLVTAIAHGLRLALWQPWKSLPNPLVWVLHLAYAWLPVHLLLRAAAALGWMAPGPAVHALTLGVIGLVTLGMITRTALGHTGRPLRAGPVETAAYLFMALAALLRVLLPLLLPASLMLAVQASALLWSASFALYLWRYTPLLLRPRADGQPG
ncbi:NnrS family protein [Paucibacter sp. APW11]|uniref:NnrS family protein n=1 Tax=Roseateles aquae TaxID=3077235 RepID=A0ABU3P7F2_9BURK|nr:NnrS family protein [Paucibacter sp. APW11]MDT8998033.1 NnrS family protein [Paucibacter sp. APW11]